MWTYKPELHDEEYTFQDLVEMVNGNVYYAKLLKDRLTWQSPSTLIDEDKIEQEITVADGIFYAVGQWVRVSRFADDFAKEERLGCEGKITNFTEQGMIIIEFAGGQKDGFWPEELTATLDDFKGNIWDILYSDNEPETILDLIETELLNS